MEDIEYHADQNLDKAQIARLTMCNYITEHHNILLLGAAGCGKTRHGSSEKFIYGIVCPPAGIAHITCHCQKQRYIQKSYSAVQETVSSDSVGFVTDGRFKCFEIPNKNFFDSLKDMNNSNIGVNFFNFNEGTVTKTSIEIMLSKLN